MAKTFVNRALLAKQLELGAPLSAIANRGTGKTTASILSTLGTALAKCGTPVVPYDPDMTSATAYSVRKQLAYDWVNRACVVVHNLSLSGFEFDISRDATVTVTCSFAEAI